MKIKWNANKIGYKPCQIYSRGLEYCFISETNDQCHEFVYCKDFLQDAVAGFLHKKVASIYGFSYDSRTMPPIYLGATRLALANSSDKNFMNKMDSVAEFIHQIEKLLKLKRTRFKTCKNPPSLYKNGIMLLSGSSRWQEAPPMLSMYTLLLRIGFVHKNGDTYEETCNKLISGKLSPYQSNDKTYLSSSKKSIDKIIKSGYRKIFYSDIMRNYPKKIDIGTMHNNFGIVAFTSGSPKSHIPGWYRKKKPKPITEETDKTTVSESEPVKSESANC